MSAQSETLVLTGIRAALIDLDGTMVDTALDIQAAANLMRNDFALPPLPIETIRNFIGKGTQNLVLQSLRVDFAPERADELLPQALECFYRHYAIANGVQSTVYPGVIEGLNAFRSKGLRLACITNKLSAFAEPLLEKLELISYFDALYFADTLPRKKPDPLPLVTACREFGIQPYEAVAIGDSINDASAARAAGCRLLNVPYGYNHGEPVQELGADAIVESLLEAAQLID